MKIPLHYQISEFDCGPTTLTNMLSFLFQRKEIPQDVIRKIYEFTLDGYETNGIEKGQYGTSDEAMIQFADWLSFMTFSSYPIEAEVLAGAEVSLEPGSHMETFLYNGGAVVAKVMIADPHYVLITGVNRKRKQAYVFDPYHRTRQFSRSDLTWTFDHPFSYNCVIPYHYFNTESDIYYSFGK